MTSDDRGSPGEDPRRLRRAQPLNQALPATLKWVDTLPAEIHPLALLREYPRIGNTLARTWNDALALASYLDSLLVDQRGGRRGFPGDVHHEIQCLREYVSGRYPSTR